MSFVSCASGQLSETHLVSLTVGHVHAVICRRHADLVQERPLHRAAIRTGIRAGIRSIELELELLLEQELEQELELRKMRRKIAGK